MSIDLTKYTNQVEASGKHREVFASLSLAGEIDLVDHVNVIHSEGRYKLYKNYHSHIRNIGHRR